MNGQKSGGVNVILIALVGLFVGFIGGYVVGQRTHITTAGHATSIAGETAFCPHELDAKDQWILAEFRCPATDSAQFPLSDCHCAVAHGIKDYVKAELAAGRKGQEIREALIAQYGDRLKFRSR